MSSSKRRKIGRNDACSCGSGKKYKRCCLGQAEARAPAAPAPPQGDRRETRALLRAIHRLQALMEAGGPLGSLRFDERRFAEALRAHMPAVAREPALDRRSADYQQPWERLMERCYPDLMDARWFEESAVALDELLASGELTPQDRTVVALARSTVPERPEDVGYARLVEMALFPVQLQELLAREEALEQAAEGIRSAISVEELLADPEGMRRRHPELWGQLEGLIAEGTGLRGAAEAELDGVIERSCEALSQPDPPALLTMDAYLAMAVAVARTARDLEQGVAPEVADRHIQAVVEDEDVVSTVRRQCAKMMRGAADERERMRWAELALAFGAAGAELGIAAIRNPNIAMAYREGEEAALDRSARAEPRGIEPWLAWLRAQGETRAADRAQAAILAAAELRHP